MNAESVGKGKDFSRFLFIVSPVLTNDVWTGFGSMQVNSLRGEQKVVY